MWFDPGDEMVTEMKGVRGESSELPSWGHSVHTFTPAEPRPPESARQGHPHRPPSASRRAEGLVSAEDGQRTRQSGRLSARRQMTSPTRAAWPEPAAGRADPAASARPRPEPAPRPHRTACVSLPPPHAQPVSAGLGLDPPRHAPQPRRSRLPPL